MTTPTKFLKLIGAPWSAYHDHPYDDMTSLCYIRPTGTEYGDDEVCYIFGCEDRSDSKQQMARRDLIVQAPDMYAYVARMAQSGDTEAKILMQKIHRGEQ